VLGPSGAAAALEGSKDFAKDFMVRHNIPTARYLTVTSDTLEQGYEFLESLSSPYVLKADGLAAGKGVLIIDDLTKAKEQLRDMIVGKKFGDASVKVVIEEFLSGIEMSVFVATDSVGYKILPSAKDYKRVGQGDTGLNTGGMGAVSPVPFATEEFMEKVRLQVVEPTINGIIEDALDYKGFVFIGLINCDGQPKVIEYNVRMGDPETEVILPRITSDIVDLFDGIVNRTLDEKTIEITPQTALTVVCTSGGYPESYAKGYPIEGLNTYFGMETMVYHSGTVKRRNVVSTAGGRVLAVTALGDNIAQARERAYAAVNQISYTDKYSRSDIGCDLMLLEK
ncbi:MAG: phosphoribosylamine--glycine ligase, partial [Mucinivorans sp.]